MVRKNACDNGLRECIEGNYSGRPYVRKITGDVEAQLVALCWLRATRGSHPLDAEITGRPLGRVRDRRVDRSFHATSLSKKNELKPWRKKQWCIAPKQSAVFVCAMEDVSEVYQRERDPDCPLVCLDEATKELHGHGSWLNMAEIELMY